MINSACEMIVVFIAILCSAISIIFAMTIVGKLVDFFEYIFGMTIRRKEDDE